LNLTRRIEDKLLKRKIDIGTELSIHYTSDYVRETTHLREAVSLETSWEKPQ
jgi:hypothetical protein